ncbi:unnamed protein product [Calypogeia fissa]
MVLSPISSLAAAERKTLQQATCGDSAGPKGGLGRDSGIVEGWGGDEDEDVNIDSDEKDSRSEGLLFPTENLQLECVPTGASSSQLLTCSGMQERTESSAGVARYEDPANNNERAVGLNNATSPNVVLKGNDSGLLTGKEQVGSFRSDPVENGKNLSAPKGIRVGSSCGGSAVGGSTKRLDARRFRRDFNVKADGIPAKTKIAVPDAGQMTRTVNSDVEEGKKLPMQIDLAAGKAKMETPTKSHIPTLVKKRAGNLTGENCGKGKKISPEEISEQVVSVLQRNPTDRMVLGGEQFNTDGSKKRKFNDQEYAQACERKSSLRVRGELFKDNEDRMRRGTRGSGDGGSLAKVKLARKDEEGSHVGTSVREKRIPSKRGLEMDAKSLSFISTKVGRQNSAVDNRNQRPLQVRGNFRKLSGKEENSPHFLSGDGAKKSGSGLAKETIELDSLDKVFERRLTKREDKEKGTGENPESKLLMAQSTIARQLLDGCGGMVRTFDQKTGEKVSGKPPDQRPTRGTDKAHGAGKAQPSEGGSDESQNCTSKQWQEGERGGLSSRRRPSRSSETGTEGTGKGHVLLRAKGPLSKGSITVSEETNRDLINFEGHMHLFPQGSSGSALKMPGAGEIAVGLGENLHGKRKQSQESEMENKGRILHSKEIGQVADLEVKEGSDGEIAVVDLQAKAKKQRLTDGKCVVMSVSSADVDANLVEAPAKEALARQGHGENDKSLEEGEIGSSDSAGEQEMSKFTEPVLPREAPGETRLGEIDPTHGNRKGSTVPFVGLNDPSLSEIQLRPGQVQVAVEKVQNKGRTSLLQGVRDGSQGAVGTLHIDGHVGTYAGSLINDENSEPDAVSGGAKSQRVNACSDSTKHETDCTDRRSVQEENQIDEICVPDHRPTSSHESRGRDQEGESKFHSACKLERVQTSEFEAVSDLIGEDRSDSDDVRTSDHHNSYCEYCRQGGELLCCDGSGCMITYHLECTDPKLGEVPSGNWYCPMCAHKRLSYGVHAVSKSVESIWDVRNCAQSSGHPCSLPKNVSANDLIDKDLGTTERSLQGTRGMHVTRDKVEDECIAAVTVVVDDEEGILGIGEATARNQVTTPGTDEHCKVQWLTERRQANRVVRTSEKSRITQGKIISGSSSSAMQGPKLVDESGDKEYFVKWRGISHAHNTWVAESELTKLSPKGLARFKKKIAEGQVVQWNSDWAEPQRLVDKRVSIPPRRPGGGRGRGFLGMDTQQEWFVKWKGLGYEHCTWEPAHSGVLSDVKVKQLELIFDRWTEAARQRNDLQRVVEADKLREASYKQLQSQPEWIRFGKLLPYQLDRLNQLRQRWHNRQNTILVDQDDQQENSSTTVTFLLSLIEEYGVYRLILVVVPAFEIQCWEAEITENAPQVNTVVYMGSKEARGVIQRFELNRRNAPLKVQVVLTTCEIAFSDFDYLRKHKWEVVVVDESQLSKTAKSHRAFLQFDTAFWLLFIGELSKYNVEELQQMLFFFQPQSSSSTSSVRNQLTGLDESGQLQYLKGQLREHIIRDSRREDASGLQLVECWVGTDMTSLQIRLYCNTLTKHYNLLQSGRLRSDPDSPSLHDFVAQLRLCCQHPYLVDPTLQGCGKEELPSSHSLIDAGVEASEKWQLIHAMLPILHKQHHRVVILSQSLMQLYFLDDYLRQKYGADSYELVDTKLSAHRKNSAVQRFNAKDSVRSFILVRTGASGFSLKLKDKDVVIIHDSDLNPANDLEYLRKVLHRVDGELKVFRLYQRFTVEEASMLYDRQKKLGADPKPLSVKILQQLLRWKVQHILELDSSSSNTVKIPKGKQKFHMDVKATQDLKLVSNILQGNLEMEAATETDVDELWNEEDGDSIKEFWFSLLKDRYAELQDREEQSNPGKGLRQRKRVQYSEEALALAPYSAPEEEEFRRKRRKPQLVETTSIPVNHDKETHSSLPVLPSTPKQAENCEDEEALRDKIFSSRSVPEVRRAVTSEFAVGLTVPGTDQIADEQSLEPVGRDGICKQRNQEAELKTSSEAIISSLPKKLKKEELLGHASIESVRVNKSLKPTAAGSVSSTTSQVDSGKRLRMEQKQQLLKMEPELRRIGDILRVEESIAGYSQQLLSHVMNNFRMPKEPRELVVMVEISLCLIACAHFRQVVEHLPAVSQVGEQMNLALKKEEFASVYSRLEAMCKTFVSLPSVQQGVGDEEIFLDEAAHSNTSSQPVSTGIECPVQIPPNLKVSESSPSTNSNVHPSSRQQASIHQNNSSRVCIGPVSKAVTAHLEQDVLPGTRLEQSKQPAQAGDCEVTGLRNGDPTVQGHSYQETPPPEVNPGLGQIPSQLTAVPSEHTQLLLPGTGETIRARLKSDKDQLLHSWLAKQKLEVQEFNAACARERDACQKSFENQKSEILTTVKMQQRDELLRQLGDVYASLGKLFEREGEDRRQEMNSTQRDLRDRINALYTKLLQLITTGTLPDLVSEARSLGLTFAVQSQTPGLLEQGPTHSKQSLQVGAPRAHESAPIPRPVQNADPGSFPNTLGAKVPPHPQHQTQLQPRETEPSPPSNSQTPLFQSQLQSHAHVLPQVQIQPQAQAHLQSPQVTTFSQSSSQAMSSNLDKEVSPSEGLVAAQPQCSHPPPQRSQTHFLQHKAQAKERSQPSQSLLNIEEASSGGIGSERNVAVSIQELERTLSVIEHGVVQPPQPTEHARVSEMLNTATVQQLMFLQASQTPTDVQSRTSQILQIPINLQPRVTQNLHTSTSLQARSSRSTQASPSLQPRVPQTVVTSAPTVSESVDALTNLQPRVSQIRRPLSTQHAARHLSSLHNTAVPHIRVQTQLQPSVGQGASSSVSGTLSATQTRSNLHSQNAPLGAHASQSAFGPDPLVHEENRLRREQEKVRLLYNEETAQIKAQYDREATELRRKYEGLLYERARTFEQKTAALKENLDKVDRNRQLAEALKLRSMLDQQKVRQTPGHSMDVISGSGQAGRLSGHTAHISGRGHLHPFHQTNVFRNGSRSIGRGFAGTVINVSGPGSGIDTGTPNSTSQVISGGSHLASWQSSRSSNIRNVPPPGLNLGGPLCSALPTYVPRPLESFSSTGFVSVPEALPHTNPSLSGSSSPFSVISEGLLFPPQTATALSFQQGRTWASRPEGNENGMVPPSSVRMENLSSHNSNSEMISVLSSSTAAAMSITTAVSSPTVTEAVVVSVSPVLSPVGDQLTNIEVAGNVFVQGGQNNFGSGPLSADAVNDLLMPLPSDNQISSTFETRLRNENLVEAELEELSAPSHGHHGLVLSQPMTVGISHNPRTPPVPIIYLSDDDE